MSAPRKLTGEQVIAIRAGHPSESMHKLAARYGITAPAILKILRRDTYKDIQG